MAKWQEDSPSPGWLDALEKSDICRQGFCGVGLNNLCKAQKGARSLVTQQQETKRNSKGTSFPSSLG